MQVIYYEYFEDKIFAINILAGIARSTLAQVLTPQDFTGLIRYIFSLPTDQFLAL
jgi:hypothetical protein